MFNRNIVENGLIDEIASTFFEDRDGNKRIIGNTGPQFRTGRDRSLLTTARALLWSRMPENTLLIVKGQDFGANNFSRESIETLCGAEIDELKSRGTRMENANLEFTAFELALFRKGNLEHVDAYFQNNGWEKIEKVTLFFQKSFPCSVYVNREERISFFAIERPSSLTVALQCYQVAQCAILTANPWFYDAEKDKENITTLDKELIQSIYEGNFDEYMRCVRDYVELYDFRRIALRKQLERFETALDRQREENLVSRISSVELDIREMMGNLSRYIREKQELEFQLTAVKLGIASKENVFLVRDYFDNNKNAKFIRMEDGDRAIIFSLDSYLNDWDESLKNSAIHNHRSVMFCYIDSNYHADAELLYTAIFDTGEIKVPMSSAYRMRANGDLDAYAGMEEFIDNEHMPNPHTTWYACLGGYRSDIADAMLKEDRLYALEIANVAAGNVNFADNTVMEKWTRWMFHQKCEGRHCFELPDGRLVTIDEAIAWLKSKEESHE